jgi:predicted SAM-dependent methyltransferase
MLQTGIRSARRVIGRSPAQLRFRDLVMRAGKRNMWVVREDLARRYLHGEGIEIGALTSPLRVPPGVIVHHVDRMSRADLIAHEGPTIVAAGNNPNKIPDITVVDDAARLSRFADQTLDFVIANHVLEHLEDPIGALTNMLRVVRPRGVLLLTLPDPRYTFDARRPVTTVEHAKDDHVNGPHVSRQQHYEEWARLIEGLPEPAIESRVAEFARNDARHHFHVWRLPDFLALLLDTPLPAELVHAQAYLREFAVVLRRTEGPESRAASTVASAGGGYGSPPRWG